MLITTINPILYLRNIQGQYQILGLVSGKEVRVTSSMSHAGATFKSLLGGNANGYIRSLNNAQSRAINTMETQAAHMNGNAIIGCRIDSDSIGTPGVNSGDLQSITVYGTALYIPSLN